MKEKKFIEVCLGAGMNQFFPEYLKIEIPQEDEVVEEKTPKKRGRKKKSEEVENGNK
jgi:hypothetical protein